MANIKLMNILRTFLVKLTLTIWSGGKFGAAVLRLIPLGSCFGVVILVVLYFIQTKSREYIHVKEGNGGSFLQKTGIALLLVMVATTLGVLVIRSSRGELTAFYQEQRSDHPSHFGPGPKEDDMDDLNDACTSQTREPGPNEWIQDNDFPDRTQQAKTSDYHLGSDEADATEQENEYRVDDSSDDLAMETKPGPKTVGLKWLLQRLIVLFLVAMGIVHMRLNTRVDPYSTKRCDPKYNGTSQYLSLQDTQTKEWKATLRSLADPSWLAGGYSQQQQVSAVPFTRVDEANADAMDIIRRRLVTPDLPIQETGHGDRDRVESLAEDDRLPIQETGNDDRIESLADDSQLRRLASSAHRGKRIQNSQSRDLTNLDEENERLRRQRDCVLCLCKARDVLFMPCCHLVSCQDCSDKLTRRCCPICREYIAGRLRVYFSGG